MKILYKFEILENTEEITEGSYSLTPWCRILFEKPIVTQLIKKYPTFLRNPKVHHRVHKSPPPDPILSQPNPVRPSDMSSPSHPP
jgi:hypothetical protein